MHSARAHSKKDQQVHTPKCAGVFLHLLQAYMSEWDASFTMQQFLSPKLFTNNECRLQD